MQHLKRAFTAFTVFATILWSLGLTVFNVGLPAQRAKAALTGVTLSDPDTTGFGLDGRDFQVTWTTDGVEPAGYATGTGTDVYIVPSSIVGSLNAANVKSNGCSGLPCQPRGFSHNYFQTTAKPPDFETKDSTGTAWSASTAYRACVFTDASSDTLNCSTADFSPTSETSVTDTQPPFVDHMPVFNLTGASDAVFNALIRDDVTTTQEFASSTPQSELKLFYGTGLTASVNGAQVLGSLFSFTVASTTVPAAGQTFQYYIRAKDKAGQTKFFCQNFSATNATDCQPIVANAVTAGSRSISGTIKQSGTIDPIAGAKVFIGGYATAAATTNGSGQYTISGLPNNSSFDIIAYKNGYCDNRRFMTIGTSDLTGVDFNLNLGECTFTAPTGGGGGGTGPTSGGKPHVMFSGPPDFGFAQLNEKIRVGFDQALNAATITGTNVYLTPDDGTTKVTGTVTYCASKSTDANNPCSNLFTGDQNVILFIPSANLSANIFYTLVITEAVTSSSGQSVEGNRQGGGHNTRFNTGGDTATTFSTTNITTNFGTGGMFTPSFVQSVTPGPGANAPTNTKILITFNEAMKTDTITTTNIKLQKLGGALQTISVALDNNTKKDVTITPSTALTAGEYEVQVLGAVANANGITMRAPHEATQIAFRANFNISGSADTTPPSIFPMITSGSTGVAVNQVFEFGFNEPIDASTITTSTVTMARGATSTAVDVEYDPGRNNVYVVPTTVLAPNTAYTITLGTGCKDLAQVALASAQSFTYTTGAADTTAPKLKDARCDDANCTVNFTEPMNRDTRVDSNFAGSVLNHANLTLTTGDVGSDIINASSTATITYNPVTFSVNIKGLTLTRGQTFAFTVVSGAKDMSGNGTATAGANVFNGMIEDSRTTFGAFDNMGMFGPPPPGSGGAITEFKSQGFGNFTAEQAFFGDGVEARPFNMMAGQDVNVMHIAFKPGIVLQNDDQVVLTFPSGMGVAGAVPDDFSPFKADMNEAHGAGTVAFDTALDSDGVSVDATARTVTVQLGISGGTPGANDHYVIDLRGLTNPQVPKDPSSGSGYTVKIDVKRAGAVQKTFTSMPFFIQQGGSRSITISVKAGSATSPDNVTGSVFIHGGGPSGPLDSKVMITAGSGELVRSSLPDGCYFFGTEPFVTLGSNDYFGQMSPEPICVNSGNASPTKTFVLSSASATGASLPVTVKFSGISSFNSSDVDIFAGGPGRFVVKNLTGLGAPEANGYTLRLPVIGHWFIGMGPGMAKGASASIPKPLPCVPPSPVDINVLTLGATGTMSAGFQTPRGVTVDATNKTITFACTTADKTISGSVTDGTTGLANVHVDMHSQGFGAPTFAQTKSDGSFSLNVSDYGAYELCAFKDGLPPNCNHIEVLPDGSDAGTAIDIFFKGKQITGGNPLVLKMKKGSYTISGKILDSNNNAISYAPVFAEDTDKNFVSGMSSQDGSYTLFVDGSATGIQWTVRSMLPPDKTDSCGTFSKTVTITTESKSSQNITPSTGTCYTVSGLVTIGGNTLANAPVFVAEWDAANNRPAAAGIFRPTNTNSNGIYTAKVAGSKTYRIGVWTAENGEVSRTVTVATSNIDTSSDANGSASINSGTLGTATLAFTGGTATMEAFAELKSATDQFKRISKTQKGLNTNMTFSVTSGNYNYFVNVMGVGQFSGTVATGATATIDLSSSNVVTLSGNINDGSGSDIAGAAVTLKASDGTITTVKSDASGNYSAPVKAGTYTASVSTAGYIPPQAATVSLTTNTANYDWGGANPDQTALQKSDQVISGTIYKSGGTTPVTEGFVQAENTATGAIITAPIGSDGTYSIPVNDGTFQVKAASSGHAKTTLSTDVTLSGTTDATAKNITLTADATKTSSATTESIAANVGGSVDDADTTGLKVTAGAGVLDTSSSNVTMTLKKSFEAPDTTALKPLGDALFEISAQTSSSAVKDTNGNVEVGIDYTSVLSTLPTGVSESDLKLVYRSEETGSYVPVEGGFTVDVTNNKIIGQVDHFTDFAIVYAPVVTTSVTPSGGTGSSGGGGAGMNVQDLEKKPVAKTETKPKIEPIAYAPVSQKSAAALQIERIFNEAKVLIKGSVDEVLKLVKAKKDSALEKKLAAVVNKVVGKAKLTATERSTIDAFVVYGTPETKDIGGGERAGAIGSYQAAFGSLPKTEAAWADVLKIVKGRWPGAVSRTAEDRAMKVFEKIYKRKPDMKMANDNAAVAIMAYGLRPSKRNLASEGAAIKTFKAIYGRNPFKSEEWDQVRAIAYSGASRTPKKSSTVKTAGE